jgi:hypothetical protein
MSTNLRQSYAEALAATNTLDDIDLEHTLDLVMAVRDRELKRLRQVVADYDNTISWDTTCREHARLLDECRRQEERAEKAEQERDALRQSIIQRAPRTDEEIHASFLASETYKLSPAERLAARLEAES